MDRDVPRKAASRSSFVSNGRHVAPRRQSSAVSGVVLHRTLVVNKHSGFPMRSYLKKIS